MSWALVLLLALAAFAAAAYAFRLERRLWTILLATLALGLAGYATQASPGLPGAPPSVPARTAEDGWSMVEARKEMVAPARRSGSAKVLIADAYARRGQYANAASMLRSAIEDNPRDVEAWIALGNALVEHANGNLTPASLLAYRRASALAAGSPAPGYFLGLALIRQGRIPEARQVWSTTLENTAPAAGEPRALLAQRAARLDALLVQAGALPPPGAPAAE